ncbi:allantoinase PuuE [Elioraea sp.]|uniref:allantoinase PuuE n=1 Tax=Elioraea sp. TaxID=2185103 RepID=UPI0025C211AD|nr:allantoinase PuuE [Elioraea sp.]
MTNPYDPRTSRYPRDLVGYGATPPDPRWPNDAKLAVQIVLNYEEGGENSILHGDAASEAYLTEVVGTAPWPGMRNLSVESQYEYGARAGFWRIHRLFTQRNIPLTVYAVTMALARNPDAASAMVAAEWEIASHAMRWIDYRDMPEEEERREIAASIALQEAVTGSRPVGWYTGRFSANTKRLVSEAGGFLYLADSYADDLPYWEEVAPGRTELIVPYTLDNNDMRFGTQQGFNTGEDFARYLIDAFDVLLAEGRAGAPKMMSIGLHCRLVGRPGRLAGLARFLDHAQMHGDAWFCRRADIARHWRAHFPPPG